MATSVTTQKETTVSVTKRQKTTTRVTTQENTTVSTQRTFVSYMTARGETSIFEATHQESSVFMTTHLLQIHDNIVVTIVGSNISLPCSSSIDTVSRFRWTYFPVGSSQSVSIYNGRNINLKLPRSSRLRVSNCDARHCFLTVADLQLHDAGDFTCSRSKFGKRWSLTILGE